MSEFARMELATKPTRKKKQPVKRAAPSEPCRHPITRRIGTTCAVCGQNAGTRK